MTTPYTNLATCQPETRFVRESHTSTPGIGQTNNLQRKSANTARRAAWLLIALLAVCLATGRAAYAQSVGSRSLQNITQTSTAATGWTQSIWSCGKDHIYWRTVTYNVTGTVTNNTVSYADWWDKFWDRGGVITASTTTPLAARTITVTEYRHLGLIAGPPPGGLPGANRYSVTDPPPVDDTGYYFLTASGQVALPGEPTGTTSASYLATLGSGYMQAANSFGNLLSDYANVNDPHGLRSTFLSDFTHLQSDFASVGSAMQSGIPTSGSPFASLASDLNTFTSDLTKLPGSPNYVNASPYLTAAANSLNDAANQVNAGICDSAGNPNCNGSQFLADMGSISGDFLNFSITESTPEPSSLVLLGSSVLGIGGLLRKRWQARA